MLWLATFSLQLSVIGIRLCQLTCRKYAACECFTYDITHLTCSLSSSCVNTTNSFLEGRNAQRFYTNSSNFSQPRGEQQDIFITNRRGGIVAVPDKRGLRYKGTSDGRSAAVVGQSKKKNVTENKTFHCNEAFGNRTKNNLRTIRTMYNNSLFGDRIILAVKDRARRQREICIYSPLPQKWYFLFRLPKSLSGSSILAFEVMLCKFTIFFQQLKSLHSSKVIGTEFKLIANTKKHFSPHIYLERTRSILFYAIRDGLIATLWMFNVDNSSHELFIKIRGSVIHSISGNSTTMFYSSFGDNGYYIISTIDYETKKITIINKHHVCRYDFVLPVSPSGLIWLHRCDTEEHIAFYDMLTKQQRKLPEIKYRFSIKKLAVINDSAIIVAAKVKDRMRDMKIQIQFVPKQHYKKTPINITICETCSTIGMG